MRLLCLLFSCDKVRFDRKSKLVRERLEPETHHPKFEVEVLADIPLCAMAGDKANIDLVLNALFAPLNHSELAKLYGVSGSNRILMEGPPGCGKTLLARASASECARRLGKSHSFAL